MFACLLKLPRLQFRVIAVGTRLYESLSEGLVLLGVGREVRVANRNDDGTIVLTVFVPHLLVGVSVGFSKAYRG